MLDPPEILYAEAQSAAVIHVTVPKAEIQDVMSPAFEEVIAVASAQGIGPAGPVFAHHLRMDPTIFDFEIGVPVTSPVEPVGRVRAGELPTGRIARTVYRGGYEGLGAAWGEFSAWITAQGLTPAPNLWERYVVGPETDADPGSWQTELNRPVMG